MIQANQKKCMLQNMGLYIARARGSIPTSPQLFYKN